MKTAPFLTLTLTLAAACHRAPIESTTTTTAATTTAAPAPTSTKPSELEPSSPSSRAPGGCETLVDVEAADTLRLARADGSIVLYANEQVGLAVVDVSDPDRPKVVGRVDAVGEPAGVFEVRGLGVLVYTPADGRGVTVARTIDIGASVRSLGELTLPGTVRDVRRVGDFIIVTREGPGARTVVSSLSVTARGVALRDEVTLGGTSAVAGASPRGIAVARAAPRELGVDRTSVTWIAIEPELGALAIRGTATFSGVIPRWRSSHRVLDVTEDDRARLLTCTNDACEASGPAAYAAIDFSTPVEPKVTTWSLVASAGDGVIGFEGTRLIVARPSRDRSDASDLAFYRTESGLVPAGTVRVRGTVGTIAVRDSGDVITVGWTGSATAGKRAIVHHIDGRGSAPRLVGAATFGGDWTWTRAYDDDRILGFDPLTMLAALPMTTVRGRLGPTTAAQVLSLEANGPRAIAEEPVALADRLLFVKGRLLAFSPDGVVVLRGEGEPGVEQRWGP